MQRLVFTALAFAAATPVSAQDFQGPAVVVTATRFPERRLDAPVGMVVISADEIARDTARTLPELLFHLGGVNVRDNSGSPDRQLDLRGFGITGDQNTLVLLDGVRLNENDLSTTKLSSIPLSSIERIEILPGSGSVQYGAGATGGTINIITRSPAARQGSGSIFAGAGSYAAGDVRAGVDLGGDKAGFALNAGHQEGDNYRENNRLRQDNLIGDLRYGDAGNGVGLKFGADTQRLQLPGVRNEIQYQDDPRGASTPGDWSARSGGFATLSFARPLAQANAAADLSYRASDSTAFFANFAPTPYSRILESNVAFSPRVRWPFAVAGIDSVLVAGLDWSGWDYDRRFASTLSSFGAPGSSTSGAQQNFGGYLQYSGRLAASTKVTLGARSQWIRDHRIATGFGATDQSQTQTPTAWEIGISQGFAAIWEAYAKIGTSFRAANVDENGATATGNLLQAQTARSREIGIEVRPQDARLRASLYQIDLDNEIYFSPIVIPFGANTNLSPTQRSGAELSGQLALTRRIDLAGSFAYQVAKFRNGVYGGKDVSGKDIPLVPRQLASLRLSWRVTDQTLLGAGANYVGRQRYDNDQDNVFPRLMPAYALFDVKLSRAWSGWVFALSVNNLFDEKYFSYGLVDIFGQCGTPTCVYPQAGRTAFASAEYRFR